MRVHSSFQKKKVSFVGIVIYIDSSVFLFKRKRETNVILKKKKDYSLRFGFLLKIGARVWQLNYFSKNIKISEKKTYQKKRGQEERRRSNDSVFFA